MYHHQLKPIKTNRKAFSLVEIIVVMTVLGIISCVFGNYLYLVTNAWSMINTQNSKIVSERLVMDRVIDDIRQIGYYDRDNWEIKPALFKFNDENDKAMEYRLKEGAPTVLTLSGQEMLDDLTDPGGLQFTYYDGDGRVTDDKDAVRSVRVRISTRDITLESVARIRNL